MLMGEWTRPSQTGCGDMTDSTQVLVTLKLSQTIVQCPQEGVKIQ